VVDFAKDISQKIRDASRPRIGPIRRGIAGVTRAPHPGIGVDWNKTPIPLEFIKHSYVLVRSEEAPIYPEDFYRTNAGIVRETLLFVDGNFFDTADPVSSVGACVRYSTRLSLPIPQNVVMSFGVSSPVKLFVSYTPLGSAEIPVMYALEGEQKVYIDFFGGDIAVENMPSGWVQLDIYLYAPNGFSYIREGAGILARAASASKASRNSLPVPPTWDNHLTAVTTAPVSANATSVPATIVTETFPPWGIVTVGDEPVSFSHWDEAGLHDVTDLNESHGAGEQIAGGAMWPEVVVGDAGQSLLDFRLRWNLPAHDADGFPIKDAINVNLFEVVFEEIDTILELGDNFIMTSGDVLSMVSVGDRLRISFSQQAYYDGCVVAGVLPVGSQTKIILSTPLKQWVKDHYNAILEASLCRAQMTKISEFRGNVTSERVSGIPRVGSKHYCLSASVYDAGESAYSEICSNHTFPYCVPPDPAGHVQLVGGSSFIVVELSKSYFEAFSYAYVTGIKLSVLSTNSSTRSDDVSKEVQLYAGGGEPFRQTVGSLLAGDQSVADVHFHFYMTITGGGGLTGRYWLGSTQLGADVVPPDPPILSPDNFIVNYDDLDDEPFAEEAMQKVASILSAATASEDKVSPVVVVGLEKPAQAGTAIEIACRPAAYWGVIDSVDTMEEKVYASGIVGEDGGSAFVSGGLRGLVLIDSAGNMFTIRSNTTTSIGYFWNVGMPDPAVGEFGVVKMPTTLEDEGLFVPQVPNVKTQS